MHEVAGESRVKPRSRFGGALGLERGHRILPILRKDGKVVTTPLAPRTGRPIELAIGERAGHLVVGDLIPSPVLPYGERPERTMPA